MKSIIAIILTLFLGFQLSAQDKTATSSKPANPLQTPQQSQAVTPAQPLQPATPEVPKTAVWNEMTHDFGRIKLNEPATVTFSFTNTGTEPIVISTARSSCGCTVAEYTKEPVKPGGSGTVKATYNSAKAGGFQKTVTVTFNGNSTPDVLTIKGNVEATPQSN